jgi:4-amino-4-deoxy-L-arabinose transferase-like glycosyltransferase
MSERHPRLVLAWLAWTAVVLSQYYVQVWRSVMALPVPGAYDTIGFLLPVLLLSGAVAILRRVLVQPVFSRPPDSTTPPERFLNAAGTVSAIAAAGAAALTVPWLYLWPRLESVSSTFGVRGLPSLGEAAARLIVAVVGASLTAGATLSSGALVLRALKCRFACRSEHLAFAAVSGIPVISYASLLLAVLGIYRPLSVALLIASGCAAGIPAARRTGRRVAAVRAVRVTCQSPPLVALIVVALGYGLVAALAPEKEYDALWYHLNLPRLWLAAGRPVDLIEEYVSLYPLTWELYFAAGMTLGGPVAAKLLHFACLPLLCVIVWHASRRYLPGASAVAAVALLVTAPTLLWESSTAYVDLALALHVAAACYALTRYAENGEPGWGALAALQFGAAAATKHLGAIATMVALALYAASAMRRKHARQQVVRRALAIAFVAALIPSPWYVRSWRASGNPVFPEMYRVFGASPAGRWDDATEHGLATFKARFGKGRSLRNLLVLPWDVTVHGAQFGGSLGPLFLILVPALLITRKVPRAVPWLAGGVVLYVAMWASPLSSYQLRFLMPIVAPLALLGAASLETLCTSAEAAVRPGRRMVTIAVFGLAIINLPPFTRFHEADRVGWNGWLTHVLRESPLAVVIGRQGEHAYLRREVPSYEAWQWINTHLPAAARVLTTTGGDQLYAQRARVPFDATIARPAVWRGPDELDAAVASLRGLGITHVLFDRRDLVVLREDGRVLASAAFQAACAPEYADNRFVLCGIDYGRFRAVGSAAAR